MVPSFEPRNNVLKNSTLIFFFLPNLSLKPRDELKHPVTSTMAPLIATQFRPTEESER